MRHFALYLCVATGEQSVRSQHRDLETAAGRRDWTVIVIYNDDGISGTKAGVASSLG